MKLKQLLTAIMICLSVSLNALQPSKANVQPKSEQLVASLNSQETIQQLQNDNKELREHITQLEKEVDYYRSDVKSSLALIVSILTVVMAVVGVVVPLILNSRSEKNIQKILENTTTQAERAEEQARLATEKAESVSKETEKALNAAKDAKASQLFAQALSEEDHSVAIKLYTKAIEILPDFSKAYNNRGILKAKTNDYEGALQDFNTAIEKNPNLANAYYNRGNLKIKNDDIEGALAEFDKGIELNPNDVIGYLRRGNLKVQIKDYDGAKKD